MKNIIIQWALPTTRQLGGPLAVGEIASVEIELSADSGATYAAVGSFTPDILEVPVNDLPFSDQYIARGRVVDTLTQAGNYVEAPFTLADDSPPGDLTVNIAVQ